MIKQIKRSNLRPVSSSKIQVHGIGLQSNRAFTLVELIVVITILAILGTIAFISLQGYSASSRDTVRISDVSNMKTSLELFHLNAGKYPLPDNFDIVDYNGGILWYQGTFGKEVISSLSRNMSEIPTDSLSDKEYTYSVANNKNEFQILTLLEGDLAYSPHLTSPKGRGIATLVSQTNAATSIRIPRLDGQYNGVFIKTAGYIVPTPSIITAENVSGGLTLSDINIKSQVTTNGENIPDIGNINSATGKLTGLKLSVYTGSVISTDNDIKKEEIMKLIQEAYTGSVLATDDIYSYILSKTTTEELADLLDTVVLSKTNTITTLVEQGAPLVLYSSCNEILINNPGLIENKIYTIDPENNGIGFEVYCDMTNQGGGWTLYAHHADNVTPIESIGTIVPLGGYGVLSDVRWQSIKTTMTTGMMMIDEHDNITTINSTKLNSGSCKTPNDKVSLTDGTLIFHDEKSGCNLTGADYTGIELRINNLYGANVFQNSNIIFDIWPYSYWYSQDYQNELYYYIK